MNKMSKSKRRTLPTPIVAVRRTRGRPRKPLDASTSGKFAAHLLAARCKAGLSVADAAASIGVGTQAWYNWEAAARFPARRFWGPISRVLRCRIAVSLFAFIPDAPDSIRAKSPSLPSPKIRETGIDNPGGES